MIILDVREREEYEVEHIPESICCPLSQFHSLAPGLLKNIKDSEVTIMCRTGARAKMALNELKKYDLNQHQFSCYEGGIIKWRNEGKAINGKGAILPIMRQVQIVASSMIFLAFIGSHFIAAEFIYLSLFVGFGLALSGYTGFCPMVFLLQKMPWNSKKTISCSTSSNKGCCD